MENFKDVKVGDKLVWISLEDGPFVKGGVYEVTEARESKSMIMVGGTLVHESYAKYFAMGDREGQPKSHQATDFTVDVEGKPFNVFGLGYEMMLHGTQEELVSPSGYVSKTTHQSVGDVTTTVSYHFEKYEDFQRYEDSLKEED